MPTLPRPPSGAGENTGQPGFAERLLEAALGPMAEDASQPMPGVVPAPVADKAIGLAMPAVAGMAAPVTVPPTDLDASETALPAVETQAEIALRMRVPDGALQQVSGSPPAPEPSGEVPPPTSPDTEITAPASDEAPDTPQDEPADLAAADAPDAGPADDAAPMPSALPPVPAPAAALPDAPARPTGQARAEGADPATTEPIPSPEAAPAKPAPVAALVANPAATSAAPVRTAPVQTAQTQAAPLRPAARAGAEVAVPAAQQAATPPVVAAAQIAPASPDPLSPDAALPRAPAEGPPLAALPEGASAATSGGTAPASAPMALPSTARIDRAEWPQAMAMTLTESLPDGGTMVIELAPEELGRLRIVLTLEGDRASVQFQTESDAAARLLSQQERALAVELARNGMSLAGHDAQSGGGWSAPRGPASASGAATGGDGGPDTPPPPPLHRGIVNLIA